MAAWVRAVLTTRWLVTSSPIRARPATSSAVPATSSAVPVTVVSAAQNSSQPRSCYASRYRAERIVGRIIVLSPRPA
jgi:hypothetical protein